MLSHDAERNETRPQENTWQCCLPVLTCAPRGVMCKGSRVEGRVRLTSSLRTDLALGWQRPQPA